MIWGVVLAAGRGRRIGTPKALLVLDQDTFYQRAVRGFREAGLPVVVVVNQDVQLALPAEVEGEYRVMNPDPDQESGMFGSVRLGVSEALGRNASGAILLPVDHPRVTSGDLELMEAQLRRGSAVVVATHAGRRGHPIGLARVVMEEVVSGPAVATLRDVVRRDRGRVVEVPVSAGAVLGVNTNDDLERLSR